MENKKYKFYGVDFKTELSLGLVSGLVFIIIWPSLVIFYYQFNNLDSILRIPFYIFFGAMFLGLTLFIICLRYLGKKYRGKWIINKCRDSLEITYKASVETIEFNQIEKIILNGGQEMRYFTIQGGDKRIKIRLGTSFLTPFSTLEDIKILDAFIKDIQPYLDKNFTKKDRTVSLSPPGTIKLTYKRKNNRYGKLFT